jgi:hypothetical protein
MRHLDEVLSIMKAHSLYAKESKCEFGMTEPLYLGHIISAQGVQVHQEKIRSILDWPTPRNVTELRSSFGLCIYYKRFVLGFFSAWSTADGSYQACGFHLDRGVTEIL